MSAVKKAMHTGFTLVELLIVVIILAVLAAIVVPQFTGATLDAKEGALDANLSRMRSAIELYYAQHSSVYPGDKPSTAATCTGGTVGTATAAGSQAFQDQMLLYSNAAGGTCTVQDLANGFKYGPYLKKGLPAEPVTGSTSLTVTSTGTAITVAATAAGGWAYDTKTGQILANIGSSTAKDRNNKDYSTH